MTKQLFVNKIYMKSESSDLNVTPFESINSLNHFSIDSKYNSIQYKPIPRLNCPKNVSQIDLSLINDCYQRLYYKNNSEYKIHEWIKFLESLQRNELIVREKPGFVTTGDILSEVLSSIYRDLSQHNKVYAQKFEDVIYLFRDQSLDIIENEVNETYYEVLIHRLQTFMTNTSIDGIEFHKHFTIDSLKLNDHRLIVLNEIKAMDENEDIIELKIETNERINKIYDFIELDSDDYEAFHSEKLKVWSKCKVINAKSLITGRRDKQIIHNIVEEDVEEIPDVSEDYWSPNKCFEFTDRLLDFIKSCVTEESLLYEFHFNLIFDNVECYRIQSYSNTKDAYFLPQFYTNSSNSLISEIPLRDECYRMVSGFDSIKTLTHFMIDSSLNYIEDIPIPLIVLRENSPKIDLNPGFDYVLENNKMINDYESYRNNKWICFLKCLMKNNLIEREKPDFVSFGGMVSNLLTVYYNYSSECKKEFHFYAQKYNGVIYLFGSKNFEVLNPKNRNITKFSYYGLKFAYLMTDRDIDSINEFEKHFTVNALKLKKKTLLVLSEIDAINERGEVFDLKASQKHSLKKNKKYYSEKLLRDWSQYVVRDVKTVTLGSTESGIVDSLTIESVDTIPNQCADYWSGIKCFQTCDKMLEFITTHVRHDLLLYKFSIHFKLNTIHCNRFDSKQNETYFLPQFYINQELR